MVLGMSLSTFTLLHVLISLAGILSGLVFMAGLLAGRPRGVWSNVFLFFTVATSVTGFLFPLERLLPSHIFGIISLVALALAILGRAQFHLVGGWARVYGLCSVLALYLNCFVLIVQSFQKVPFLNALAPTQSEPPFAVARAGLLVIFLIIGIRVAKRYKSEAWAHQALGSAL